MAITRRRYLQHVCLAPVALAMPHFAAAVPSAKSADLVIYDARHAASRRYVRAADSSVGARRMEVSELHAGMWRELRHAGPLLAGSTVAGLTTWSDWTIVRGLLTERGLRVCLERRRPDGLFEWSMA